MKPARALVVLALLAPLATAQTLLTPHRVATLRAVTDAQIAPDGARIAYVRAVPRTPGEGEDGPAWAELHVVDRATGASVPRKSPSRNRSTHPSSSSRPTVCSAGSGDEGLSPPLPWTLRSPSRSSTAEGKRIFGSMARDLRRIPSRSRGRPVRTREGGRGAGCDEASKTQPPASRRGGGRGKSPVASE